MTDDLQRHRATRVGRATMGERLGGFIYGTIVVLSVVVAGARAYPHDSAHIAGLVIATTVAFWLAHVYAHALAHSVARDQHLSAAELLYIARREASIMEAALPPVASSLRTSTASDVSSRITFDPSMSNTSRLGREVALALVNAMRIAPAIMLVAPRIREFTSAPDPMSAPVVTKATTAIVTRSSINVSPLEPFLP